MRPVVGRHRVGASCADACCADALLLRVYRTRCGYSRCGYIELAAALPYWKSTLSCRRVRNRSFTASTTYRTPGGKFLLHYYPYLLAYTVHFLGMITFRRDAFPVPIVDCIVGCPFRFGLSIVDRAVGYRFRYPWLSIIDCWLPIVFVRWLSCTTAVVFL